MQTKQPLMPRTVGIGDDGIGAAQALRCPRCQGKGYFASWVHHKDAAPFAPWFTWIPCPKCHGTGYLIEEVDTTKEEAQCQ